MRLKRCAASVSGPPVVGLVRAESVWRSRAEATLSVPVVLQQALVRIGEAGRRFAQCLSEASS
ncbi:hypothetical protein HRbin15_01162 [bacterium HR15]|nr:hypothetical protein HRbin15_01162 [bacterium HR15]